MNSIDKPLSGPKPSKRWTENEAQRLALAGQTSTIFGTGGTVNVASLDGAGHSTLQVEEDGLFAGFNAHATAQDDPRPAIEDHVKRAGPEMGREMLFAQTRAVYAGMAALELADHTGALGFCESEAWRATEAWGDKLLFAFAGHLGIEQDVSEELMEMIWQEANVTVGSNWRSVFAASSILEEERGSSIAELFPIANRMLTFSHIGSEGAKHVFELAEERV